MKKIIPIAICFLNIFICKAQTTDVELQQKYWNYRDRFKKHFSNIGDKPGGSLTISTWVPYHKCYFDNQTWNGKPETEGAKIDMGEGLGNIGDYLAFLAMEYDLLKRDHQDVTGTLNEIYYALNAIERVDKFIDKALGGSYNLNGFTGRDDIDLKYIEHWPYDNLEFLHGHNANGFNFETGVDLVVESQPTDVLNPANQKYLEQGKKYWFQHTDDADYAGAPWNGYKKYESWQYFNGHPCGEVVVPVGGVNPNGGAGNQMSQDHLINYMIGLKFVHKFVDNVFVKPTSNDAGFLIINKVQDIVKRFMDYLTVEKDISANPVEFIDGFGALGKIKKSNWFITNPVSGNVPDNGGYLTFAYSYPLSKMAESILGIHYDYNWSVTRESGTTTKSENWVKNDWWESFSDNFLKSDINAQMVHWCVAVSGTWNHQKFADEVNGKNYPWFELMYAILHDKTPIISQSIYEQWLLNSKCSGIEFPRVLVVQYYAVSDPDQTVIEEAVYENILSKEDLAQRIEARKSWYYTQYTTTVSYRTKNVAANEGFPFNRNSIFSVPNRQLMDDAYHWGEYNAVDYMMIYNMYRIAQRDRWNTNPTIRYEDKPCPCASNNQGLVKTLLKDANGASITTLSSTFNTLPRNEEYSEFEVFTPEILNHSLTILNNGNFVLGASALFCNGLNIVESGGKIELPVASDIKFSKKLFVNSSIELKSNAIIEVANNNRVVINGTLIFHPGAHIILNGPNAVLEIKGKLELKDNAVFKIEGGAAGIGYVQFENHWDAITQKGTQEIVTGNNTQMEFIGLTNNTRTQKLLEIRGEEGLWLNTNLVKCTIKNGFVDMRKDSRIISHCRDFEMNEVYVFCSDHNVEAAMHRGIHVLGTPNLITNCEIIHGNPGLRQFAIEGTSPLVVQNSNISECYEGIRVESGNLWLTNTPVQFCSGSAISFTGTSSFSKVLNCTIENNTNGALDFHGSGRYFTSKSNYRFNRYAAAITEGKVEPRCCLFSYNTERGIHVLNGSFNIQAGFNILQNNGGSSSTGISKLFSGNKAIWYLQDGKSFINLENKNGSVPSNQISSTLSALQPVIPNATPPTMPFAVNGNGNYWVQSGSGLTNSMYSLTQNGSNLFLANGQIPGLTGDYQPFKDQNCNTLPAKMPLDYMMDFINPSNSGTTFSRRNRTGSGTTTETFTNGLNSALTLAHQLLPDYEGSIMLLHDMMGINFPSADRHVWYELYNASQHVYFTALSDSAWQDSAAFPLRQNLYTIMNQKQDALLSLSGTDTIGGYWQPMHFDFVRDKSLLYRSIGQRNTAIGYINTKLNDFADTIDRNGLVVWQCIYKQEQDYLDSLIPLDSVNLHFNCIGPWLDSSSGDTLPPENMMMNNNNYQNYGDRVFKNKPKQSVDKQGKEDNLTQTFLKPFVKSKPQILFKIYPNPTDNSATVLAYNSPTETKFDLLLYNNTGTLISQMQFNSSTTLNTNNLSEGVYTVSCKGANGFNQHTKLVVIHRE